MRRLWALLVIFGCLACGSAEKKEPSPEPEPEPVPTVKKKEKEPEPEAETKPAPKTEKREPSFEELLRKDYKDAEGAYLEGLFEDSARLLNDRFQSKGLSQDEFMAALGPSDKSALGKSAKLYTRGLLAWVMVRGIDHDIYAKEGAKVLVTSGYGRSFLAWLKEKYKGQADSDEVTSIELRRLDGIQTTLSKNDASFKRLKETLWLKKCQQELERRAEEKGKKLSPLDVYRLIEYSWAWGADTLTPVWVDRALGMPECEILISLAFNAKPDEPSLAYLRSSAQMKQGLSKMTEGRSELKRVKAMAKTNKPIGKPVTNPENKPDNKPDNKVGPKPENTDSTVDGKKTDGAPVAKPDEPLSASAEGIKALYLEGVGHYRRSSNRKQEQEALKKAKAAFDKAMEAWNKLADENAPEAEKLETQISEMTVLQYDCIKRLKIK